MRNYGQRGITGMGAPRTPEIVAEREKAKGQRVRLSCKKCQAVVLETPATHVKQSPRTFEALARQASRKHDAVCPGEPALPSGEQ